MLAQVLRRCESGANSANFHHHHIPLKPCPGMRRRAKALATDLNVKRKVQQQDYFEIVFDVSDFNTDEVKVVQDGKFIVVLCEQRDLLDGPECWVTRRFERRCLVPENIDIKTAQYCRSEFNELIIRVGKPEKSAKRISVPRQAIIIQHQTQPPQPTLPPQATMPHHATMSYPASMPHQVAMPQQPTMALQPNLPQQSTMPHQAYLPQQSIMPQQAYLPQQPAMPDQTYLPQQPAMPHQAYLPPQPTLPQQPTLTSQAHHHHHHAYFPPPPEPHARHPQNSGNGIGERVIRCPFLSSINADNIKGGPYDGYYTYYQGPDMTMPPTGVQQQPQPQPSETTAGKGEKYRGCPLVSGDNNGEMPDNIALPTMSMVSTEGHAGNAADWTNMQNFAREMRNIQISNSENNTETSRGTELAPEENCYVILDSPASAEVQDAGSSDDSARVNPTSG